MFCPASCYSGYELLRLMVDNPIFDIEELMIDAIPARAYKSGESRDSNGWRMNFSVRYGDFVVNIKAER